MELKAFSKKGAIVLTAAVIFAIGMPVLVVTKWHVFKYLLPLFTGLFFFLTVNKLHIGDGTGATATATLIAWAVPLTGIPGVQEGLFDWLITEHRFGPMPIALLLYSLPAIVTLSLLLQNKRVLPE